MVTGPLLLYPQLSWPCSLLQQPLEGGEGQSGRAICWRELFFLSDAVSFLSALQDIMGMDVGTGKTGSTWSHILLNTFCVTSGLRALNFKAKNMMSLFYGSIMTAVLMYYSRTTSLIAPWESLELKTGKARWMSKGPITLSLAAQTLFC